jgi:HEAT repeat protein
MPLQMTAIAMIVWLLTSCSRTEAPPQMNSPAPNQSVDRLDQLLDQLGDTDDLDRSVEAISLIEAEAVPEWLPRLHKALETQEDFYLRESVAPAVIRLEGMVALPRLIAALRLGFAEGHDCDGLQANVTDLIASDPSAALPLLLPLADSSDPADRADAAWLLGFVHSDVRPDIFVRLAADDSPRVRGAACGSLASLKGHEPAFQMLVRRLDDTDEDVRISAMSSLGYFGDSRALPLLERLVGGSSERARHILEYAISSLKKP